MPSGVYRRTEKHNKRTSKALIGNQYAKGSKRTKEVKRKISELRKGKTLKELGHKKNCQCPFCKNKRGESCPEEVKRKLSEAAKGKNNSQYGRTGENHPGWKGGSRRYYQKLSHKVWEEHHDRKIPKGHIIHHKNENWKNIDPTNLELIASTGRHTTWHAQLRKLKERSKKFLDLVRKQHSH